MDTPSDPGNTADEIPPLDGLHEDEIDQADKGPQFPSSDKNREELSPAIGDHMSPAHFTVVDGASREQILQALVWVAQRGTQRPWHGSLDGVDEQAEEERIGGGADGLIQDQLDDGVGNVQLGLNQFPFLCLSV